MNTDENQMLRAKQGGLVPTKTALYDQYKKEVPSMAGFTDAVANARARTGKLGAKWPDTAKVIYTGHATRADRPGYSRRGDGQGRR